MLSGLLDNPLVKAGLIGAGALAGGQKQDGEKLTTTNKIDPRMDPYVYGPGGILPQAQAWYQNNKTGINPDMTAGWNMQKSILTDPTIQSRLRGMLAQQPMAVAGNPFTSGSNPYLARGM
jgi:hypothetical protein